jgi:hypothetical protein
MNEIMNEIMKIEDDCGGDSIVDAIIVEDTVDAVEIVNKIKELNAADSGHEIKTMKRLIEKIENNEDPEEVYEEEPEELTEKQKILLYSTNGLIKFYSKEVNKRILTSIINQKTAISLRLLDWLVTNYSKKFDVHYELSKVDGEYTLSTEHFNMWKDYKNQLKSYSKKLFDPFCRRKRIFFNTTNYEITVLTKESGKLYDSRTDGVITTVGQLNFFRWAIVNKVIDYAFEKIEKIESDMLSSADNKAKLDPNGKTGKRQLSKNSSSAKSQKIKIIVQFQ